MARQFLLYISAATDMDAERDLLARSVIDIPVDLTWRIAQSPRGNAPIDEQAIAAADVHLLLLGSDIRAPVGLEWITSRRLGRRPSLFLKADVGRTPAAGDFRRFIELYGQWRPFSSSLELQRTVQRLLARQIADSAITYGLTADEIAQLYSWQKTLPEARDDGLTPTGAAADSSLIFSKERFEPTKGILLDEDDRRAPGA